MHSHVSVGVSLKMYFGHRQARDWFVHVADIAAAHPAVAGGAVDLFVIPTYLQVLPALAAFRGTRAIVGAQDAATEDRGAYTGEVSAAELREVGVGFVEVGHAERRRLFGETDEIVAEKTRAVLRNGMVPVLCIGEGTRLEAAAAAECSVGQLRSALRDAPDGRVIVAYEPVWAIGAPEPAAATHIRQVGAALKAELEVMPQRAGSAVIYGGSAKPGLLGALGDSIDGLFLGRFAHEPVALRHILDEAAALSSARAEGAIG